MNLFENIAFGLRIAKVPEKEIEQRVNEALELVNLPAMASAAWILSPAVSSSGSPSPARLSTVPKSSFSMNLWVR